MTESNETEETQADEATETAPAAAAPAEPAEQLPPKEARRRARSQGTSARPQRSPEERVAERAEERRKQASSRRSYRSRAKDRAKARRAEAPAPAAQAVAEETSGRRKERQGIVVSDKADKTITVRIDSARRHRRYEKVVRTSSTLHAHDERNEANIGDTVRVVESRPLSRTKRWRLVDVLERAR
jgi:small subunit ribosomal protein S17